MHGLGKTIDSALVISLPRNKLGRFKTFSARWKFQIPLTKIDGVDGLRKTMPPTWTNGLGTLGCLLAHIKAIKFAKDKGYRNVLIMEDDIRFIQDFEKNLQIAMSELPDNWDCLWLGGADEIKGDKYSERLKTNISCWGGFGYILRDTVYDFFLEKLESLTLPCDNHYMAHQKELNSFKTIRPYILHSHLSSVRIKADTGIEI